MPILSVMLTLLVIGVILWLINTYIPMDGKIKNILNIAVVVITVLWLLSLTGILANISNVEMPRFK